MLSAHSREGDRCFCFSSGIRWERHAGFQAGKQAGVLERCGTTGWERRLSATHMRYLRACDTLARVRNLSRPTPLQINIGARQVNVAQTARTAEEDRAEQVKSVDAGRPSLPSKS